MLHPKGTGLAKKQTSQHKKQQRAIQKRTRRKQKLVRKRAQESLQDTPRRLLRRARRMPFEGAWVQRGWQDNGEARILLARTQPSDDLLFAGFVVDYLCTGIRESSYFANVNRETFRNEYLPRLYDGEPPLTISEAIANEIVWGSVEYADSLGFSPDSKFKEAQYILQPEGELPISGTVEFGHNGRPVYVAYPNDNHRVIIHRLIDAVGLGGFDYVLGAEIFGKVADLFQQDEDEDFDVLDDLWTPDLGLGDVDRRSSLWLPGQESEPDQTDDERQEPSLWVPGRT